MFVFACGMRVEKYVVKRVVSSLSNDVIISTQFQSMKEAY